MISLSLISELQQILHSDFGIEANVKEVTEISNALTKYFELLTNMNKNEKPKITAQK